MFFGAFMMTTPKIDPSRIFLQADCFYQALAILCNVEPDNTQLAVILNEPMMVIGALNNRAISQVPFMHRERPSSTNPSP
jgi:hypothetical protein